MQAYEAIRARAEALGRLPGEARSLDQRMYDAAVDLLLIDAEGGASVRPTLGVHGEPVRIRVRGIEISVLVPYGVAAGGDRELAEVPGYGPILPSTARDLLAHADAVRRVAVDANTGEVLAVDDRVPGPVDVEELAAAEVVPCELDSAHYRVPGRLRRHLEVRDRTCVFPGCHVPGKLCDVDHREPWPRGTTSADNCHCLCRRHHRAKQDYFTVSVDDDTGDTVWATPDGRRYRRPPPRW